MSSSVIYAFIFLLCFKLVFSNEHNLLQEFFTWFFPPKNSSAFEFSLCLDGQNGFETDLLFLSEDETLQYSLGCQFDDTTKIFNSVNSPISSQDQNRNLMYLIFPSDNERFLQYMNQISQWHTNVTKTRYGIKLPYFILFCPKNTFDEEEIQNLTSKNFQLENINLLSNVFITYFATKEFNQSEFMLYEVFSLKNERIVQKVVANERYTIFDQSQRRVFRRRDFRRTVIRATAMIDLNSALEVILTDINGTIQFINGSAVSLFNDLKTMLNFTEKPLRGEWITRHENGSLKGTTVEQFRNGETDLAISQTTLLPYRAVEFNFLQPTYFGGIKAFFIQPPASTIRDIFVTPFDFNLWMTIVSTWVLLLLAMNVLYWIKRRAAMEDSEADAIVKEESFLWAIGTISQQGWHTYPTSTSMQVVFISGYLTGLICYIAYSAAIVSTLSSEIVPIRSFTGLIDSSFKIYHDRESSTMKNIISNLQRDGVGNIGEALNMKQGVEKLLSGESCTLLSFTHHFHNTARTLNLTNQWLCKHISTLPVSKIPIPSSMVVMKNSLYSEFFNHNIIKLKERGFNFRYLTKYNQGTSTSCVKRMARSMERLGLNDVFTAHVILIIGYILSVVILICEKMIYPIRSATGKILLD